MRQGCIIAALFGLVGVVYWPGLEGPFIGDDFPNFVGNPFVHIHALTLEQLLQAASSNRSGPFGRPIAAVTFALNYLGAGTFDQFSFKLTNVVIHLVNTLLVYFLARALVRASSATTATLGHTSLPGRENIPWVAIVVTAIWALHPLQLTNILYGVQRMNSLACLVTLTGVLVFMVGRKRLSEGRAGGWRYTIGGVVAGTVLGVFAKENAIVLPGLAFVIELTVFRGLAAGHTLRPKLLTFYSVVLFIPAVIGTVLIVFTFDILSHGYALREFDLMQRLLTQCRVLFWFVSQTFLPDAQQMSLFHDDFPVSQSLLEPMSTLWSVFGWCVVIALCVALRRRLPWLGFAVGWFLIGHSLEGSFLPLEILYEHRNYLPSIGLILGLVASLTVLSEKIEKPGRIAALVTVPVVLALAGSTFSRAGVWSDARVLTEVAVRHQPNSARAHSVRAAVQNRIGGHLGDIYADYARASELAPRMLDSRLWQLRTLGVIEYAMLNTQSKLEASLNTVDGKPLVALTEQGLHEAREPLIEQVHALFASEPLDVGAIAALRGFAQCVEQDDPGCRALRGHYQIWLDAATRNPHLDAYGGGAIYWFKARELIDAGQIEAGLSAFQSAIDADPRRIALRRHRVATLIQLGRLAEAQSAYDALEAIFGDPVHDSEMARLHELLLRNANAG